MSSKKNNIPISEIGQEELKKLVEITNQLLSTIDYDRLLEIILEAAKTLTDSEASSLLLLDEKINKLHFAVATGEVKEKLTSLYIPMDEKSIAGYVAKTNKPLVVDDVSKHPYWYKEIDQLTNFQTRSILAVPLLLDSKLKGVIEVVNKKDFEGYEDSDVSLLQILANQAAMVLKNAEEYIDLRDRRKVEEEFERLKYKIVGRNPKLVEVLDIAKRVAPMDTTVLLTGESGTGKELLARYIHHHSPRRDKPFVAVNCAAVPSTLIESELFGYEKGAFTGATQRKPGKFELAHKGTLFLDEIGDLELATQVKILRFFDQKEFERLGGKETLKVDVRLIIATNQSLPDLIKEKKFREDLYYRINVFPLELLPLRERKEDIPLLVDHFIKLFNLETTKKIEGITPAALKLLQEYDWPGNVRELRNVIERAFVFAKGRTITKDEILIPSAPSLEIEEIFKKTEGWVETIQKIKREYLSYVLNLTKGNNKKAAKMLKIQQSYLSRLKKELNLDKEGL